MTMKVLRPVAAAVLLMVSGCSGGDTPAETAAVPADAKRVDRATSGRITGAAGGTFELTDLPPGTYTIEAWHEKAGTQTQDITIGEKEAKDVTFTFRPATVG